MYAVLMLIASVCMNNLTTHVLICCVRLSTIVTETFHHYPVLP